MIIWRGWGILAFFLFGAAMGGGFAIAQSMGSSSTLIPGLLMMVAGVGTWFLGQYMNVTQPLTKVEPHMAARTQELHALGRAGHFRDQAGNHLPPEHAYQMVEAMLHKEREEVTAALKNRHTLFFVPMQYLGFIMGGIGVFMVIRSFIG